MIRKRITAAFLTLILAVSAFASSGAALSGIGVEDTTKAEETDEPSPSETETAKTDEPSEPSQEPSESPAETETQPSADPTAPSLSVDEILDLVSRENSRESEEEALLKASLLLARRLARLAEMNNNVLAVCRTSGYVNRSVLHTARNKITTGSTHTYRTDTFIAAILLDKCDNFLAKYSDIFIHVRIIRSPEALFGENSTLNIHNSVGRLLRIDVNAYHVSFNYILTHKLSYL